MAERKKAKSAGAKAAMSVKERIACNIMIYVTKYVKKYGRLPTCTEIAAKTRHDIETVSAHLNEYYTEKKSELSAKLTDLIANEILAVMAKQALNGSSSSARVFFDAYFKMFHGNVVEIRELPKIMVQVHDPTSDV